MTIIRMSRFSGWMIVIPAVFPCSLLRSADLPLWSECRQPAECAKKRTRVMSGRTGLLKVNRAIASVLDSMARVDMVCRLRFKLGRAPRGGHCQGHARDGWGHSGHSRYRPGRAREIGWRPGARAA